MKVLFSKRKDCRPYVEKQLEGSEYFPFFSDFNDESIKNADLLFPINIGDVILSGKFSNISSRGLFPDWQVVNLAENKKKFNRFLTENSFGHFLPKTGPSVVEYPYVLKGNRGQFGTSTYLIVSQDDELEHPGEP